jgi:hypothetical protein
MSDLIERFRYRFKLWRQERHEDSFWRPGPPLADVDPSKWNDPKYQLLLTEPTWKFVLRTLGVFSAGLMLSTTIARLIVRLAPTAQFTALVVLSALLCLWTLFSLSGAIGIRRRRKAFRDQATQSSNQTLQPTASRRITSPPHD